MRYHTKYVGLDVHQETTVASVREEGGRVLARVVFPTEEEAITEFLKGMRGSVHVALEEGTQAQWLHDLMVSLVDRVVVCDRRGESRHGNKADQGDADYLSDQLRRNGLRAVYHGETHRITLKELTRSYQSVVTDSVRAMQRIKALFRARGIKTTGTAVYQPQQREEWLALLPEAGARFRAETLYAQLDVLRELRPKAKAAMLAEARKDPAWTRLQTIPSLGPVRVALILAIIQTPWRFRTKRNLWAYCGLAVVTRSSADYVMEGGRAVRRQRAPLTRGLNRNHNHVLKGVFKGAASSATGRPGPLQDFYFGMIARGMREELARVTLARKIAAITLRLWKRGESFDPTMLTTQAS